MFLFSTSFFVSFFPHGLWLLFVSLSIPISLFSFFLFLLLNKRPCESCAFCLSNEFSQYAFFKPRKLFKWVYFRLQSIWLAHSKCRALEIDDPFSEFIALIHISYAFYSKSSFLFCSHPLFLCLRSQHSLSSMYIEVFDQARLFQKPHLTVSFRWFLIEPKENRLVTFRRIHKTQK